MNNKVEAMEDGKDKELMKILAEGGKPFIRKSDGNAVKVSEDKEIKYKDYEDQELTLAVPAGSYVVVNEDSCCPKIVTAEDWESKNKFIEEPNKAPKKEKGPSIGIELMAEDNN